MHNGPVEVNLITYFVTRVLFLSLVCHTSCLCSHFICPRQVHVRPLVSVLRISPDFQILVSSRFVNFFSPVICAGLLIVSISMAPFTVQCTSLSLNSSALIVWRPFSLQQGKADAKYSSKILLGHRLSDSIFDHWNVEIDMTITKEKVREQQPLQKTE